MTQQGLECITNIRSRYDGKRRNPWDEAECGHHYARAMAAWSGLLALSGFHYQGGEARVAVFPKTSLPEFTCFWSTAAGWGVFTQIQSGTQSQLTIRVHSGNLAFQTCEWAGGSGLSRVVRNRTPIEHRLERSAKGTIMRLSERVILNEGEEVLFAMGG
jgi:hypothetical protein